MNCGIDYLAFTILERGIETVRDFGSKWFGTLVEGGGLLGYKRTWRAEGLTICYDGAVGMGIHVQISGAGCQHLLEHDRWEGWRAFLHQLFALGAIPKRIDIAYDDTSGLLSIEKMVKALEEREYTSRFSEWGHRYGRNRKSLKANVLYIGSISSPSCVCVYDKRIEQIGKGEDDPGHWVRCELRLKQEQAAAGWKWLCENELLLGAGKLLADAIQFRTSTDDTNRARWEVAHWWSCFCADVSREGLRVVRAAKSLAKGVTSFLKQHAAQFLVLKVSFDFFAGEGGFLKQVLEVGHERLNDRHRDRIAEWLNDGPPGISACPA